MQSTTPPPPAEGTLPLTSQGRGLIAVNVVFLVLPIVCVAGRIWSRRLIRAPLGGGDYSILGALAVWIGQVGYNIWATVNGAVGYPASQAGARPIMIILQQLAVSQFTYAADFFLVRLSICLLLLSIFPQTWLRRCVYVAIVINACWATYVIVVQAAICVPFRKNWDLSITYGHCDNSRRIPLYIGNAIWSIIYDTCILLVPQPAIWRLHLPTASRAALSFIFALGAIDIIVSIIRIVFVVNVNLADLTGSDYYPQVWTILEVSIAIIVANLPLMRPGIMKLFPCVASVWTSSKSRSYKNSFNIPDPSGSDATTSNRLEEGSGHDRHGLKHAYPGRTYLSLGGESTADYELKTVDLPGEHGSCRVDAEPSSGSEAQSNLSPGVVHMQKDFFVHREER